MRRLPWLDRLKKSAPVDPPLCPIPLGTRSNGEFFHVETAREARLRQEIFARADVCGRRLGLDRRSFLASSMGMASTLLAVNALSGCGGGKGGGFMGSGGAGAGGAGAGGAGGGARDGGIGDGAIGPSDSGFAVPRDAAMDAGACEVLSGSEFIFDVQTHHVNPMGEWRQTNTAFASFFGFLPQSMCGEADALSCFSSRHYVEQLFLNSDTSVAVLSGVPAVACNQPGVGTVGCGSPLDNDEIAASREIVNAMASSERLVTHAMVTPNVNLDLQLAAMERVAATGRVGAWKCYPMWGPNGSGYWLDDPAVGVPFLEKARALGVKRVCIHKGLPLPGFDTEHGDPSDVVRAAKRFPDLQFIVYHSAFRQGQPLFGGTAEGPFDPVGSPQTARLGINALVTAMQEQGLGPGSNVYAELGSVWSNVMTSPDEAAHVLGKLLRYMGEDNVVWGTDSIWYGSPQAQIEAFRAFQIGQAAQDRFGYPALTPARKAKILGLTSARIYGIDPDARRCRIQAGSLARARAALDTELGPRRFAASGVPGPRTRREFLALARRGGPA